MKILQIAPVWETVPPPAYGGTEVVVDCLVEELVRRGHEVTLWASGDSTSSAELLSIIPRSLRAAGLTRSPWQTSLMHMVMAIRDADGYDIIHNHNGPPGELGMALSHLVDVPMLTTLHNLLTEDNRVIWSNYTGWYNSISVSQIAALPVLPLAHFAGPIHNAINVESFPFREKKGDYLLSLGRLTPEKGVHLAIQAAKRVGIPLLIAGKIGTEDEQEYFDREIEPLLDGTTASFLGEANSREKRELYADAMGLLLPLQWEEPFGLVMAEAMACGTPVIAFNRGAAPEVIVDGETGFIVEDLDEMVAAIARLSTINPRRCREHVETCFSPAAMADAYLAAYEGVVGVSEGLTDRLIV